MVYKIIKPLLFTLDAELAHQVTTGLGNHFLSLPGSTRILNTLYDFKSDLLTQNVMGLSFANPVGMAAGFDKSGDLFPFLCNMGFGFVESGTFTTHAQDGNPKPRLFRYKKQKALINRMGFNNSGSENVSKAIADHKRWKPRGINLGKSKITDLEDAAQDYIASLRHLYPYADYIAINVSSPNTPGLRELQSGHHLRELLLAIKNEMIVISKKLNTVPIPLLVKIAPDMELSDLDSVLSIVMDLSLHGIILTNTTLDHSSIPKQKDQQGGLSGQPVAQKSTDFIRHAYRQSNGKIVIIGVGGIFSGMDALEKIQAGASLIQVYTGYIYEGPRLPYRINEYLRDYIVKNGYKNISEIVGSQIK